MDHGEKKLIISRKYLGKVVVVATISGQNLPPIIYLFLNICLILSDKIGKHVCEFGDQHFDIHHRQYECGDFSWLPLVGIELTHAIFIVVPFSGRNYRKRLIG